MSEEIIDYIIKWGIGLSTLIVIEAIYLIWYYYKCEREIKNYRRELWENYKSNPCRNHAIAELLNKARNK